jgi:hypothetical protein
MNQPYLSQLAVLHTPDEIKNFFDRLSDQEKDPKVLSAFALAVMGGFTADIGYLVAYYCCNILINHGTPDMLQDIMKIRRMLPLLPGIRDYRMDYSELVDVLTAKSKGMCACIPRSRYNTSPRNPSYAIQQETSGKNEYETFYLVDCMHCGNSWKVTEENGYHYPLFHWSRLHGIPN